MKPGTRWRPMMRLAAGAHQLGGEHIVLLAQRQQLRAHRARKPRPVEQAEDDGDAEIDERSGSR